MKETKLLFLSSVALCGLTAIAAGNVLLPMKHQKTEVKVEVAPNGKTISKKTPTVSHRQNVQTHRSPLRAVVAPDHDTYYCDFSTPDALTGFTIIDANQDEETWRVYDSGMAEIYWNSNEPMDDWMITPAIQLIAGERYIISFDAASQSDSYPERLEVFMGRSNDIQSASYELMGPTILPGLNDGSLTSYGFYFTPEEGGDWYIMFHGISDADMNRMMVDNICVSSPGATPIPGEEAIAYEEIVLLDQDFSAVGGSLENPIVADSEPGHYIPALPGWRGLDVYGIGGAILLDPSYSVYNWTQLAPPAVTFTHPNAEGYYRGKVSIEARVVEFSSTAAEFNNWESLGFNGMKGSTDCPGAWTWAGNEGSFTVDLNRDGEWTTIDKEVLFGGEASLIDSSFDDPHAMVPMGVYPCNTLSGRICMDFNSKAAIRSYKISELIPIVPPVNAWETTEYTPEGFTIAWDAIEDADYYMVTLYTGDYFGDNLESLETKRVTDPECHFDVETKDGYPLYVNMFVVKGELRSPTSPTFRVFQVDTPELSIAKGNTDGKAIVNYDVYTDTHLLNVIGQSATVEEAAIPEFCIADISFSKYPNTPEDTELDYEMSLQDQAIGWTAYPYVSIQDGAYVCNNYSASWGACDYMSISGNCAYDFTNHEGKLKVSVTAKTDGFCNMSARLLSFNDMTRSFEMFDSQYASLTNEYVTYNFELDPQHKENVMFGLTTGGQDTNYIKDLKVTCDLAAGELFYMPFIVGYLDFTQSNVTTGAFNLNYPADANMIRVVSQALRYLADDEGYYYYLARSPFSEAAILENIPVVGIDSTREDDKFKETEYYNLQGIRIKGELPAGVYIRKQGSKTEKSIIR